MSARRARESIVGRKSGDCMRRKRQKKRVGITANSVRQRKPNDGLKARADQVLHAKRVDAVESRARLLQTIVELGEPGRRRRIVANLNKGDGQVGVVSHVLLGRIDNDLLDLSLVARLAVRDDENGLGATVGTLPIVGLHGISQRLSM